MALDIDVKTRVKTAAVQTVPLIVLSSLFLVFFETRDWALAKLGSRLLRAALVSACASIVALAALWIGLSTAQTWQSKGLGWLAGSVFSVLIILPAIWFFSGVETGAS